MKTNPNRRNNVVVLALVGAATLATTTTLVNNSFFHNENKSSLIENQKLTNLSDQRGSITDNTSGTVTNPDTVIFTSVDLAQQNVWGETTDEPTSGKPTGSVDTTKKGYFDNLEKNIKSLNLTGELKDKLEKIVSDVSDFLTFKEIHSKWFENSMQDTVPWDDVKDGIKETLNNPPDDFEDIDSLKNTTELFKKFSGLTEEQMVSEIKTLTHKQITKSDLVSSSNSSTPPTSTGGLNDIAGQDFKTLVKIAEINLDNKDNFVLEYSYKTDASSPDAKSYLVIKNDKEQIKKAAKLDEAYKNLDIFGRYDTKSSAIGGSGSSFKSEQESIVLKRNGSTLDVLVRLKENEALGGIKFNADYGQPEKFGILDVQADSNSTFSSSIERSTNSNNKLMDIKDNSADQLYKIQFFSTQYLSKKMTSNPLNDSDANRYIEFYQGLDEEYEFSTDLNYITKYDATGQLNDYEPIKEYVAGVATNKTVSLNLKFSEENKGSTINGAADSTYNFFALLKDNMDKQIEPLFPDVSLITAKSEAKGKIAKQRIEYSDKFYLMGNPASKVSVNTTSDLENKIPNMLDKIFYEKPVVFDQQSPKPFVQTRAINPLAPVQNGVVESTIKANEQIDEKANVVRILGEVYDKWAKNDPGFSNFRYTLEASQVTFERSGSTFRNINIERKPLNGSGFQLYQGLNDYWANLTPLIKFFNSSFNSNQDRFKVTSSNSAHTVVDKFFINNFEFIPNYAQVDALIAEGIKVWNSDPITSAGAGQVPSLDGFTTKSKEHFSAILAKLLEIQYDAIVKEFEANQMFPLYQEFASLLGSSATQTRLVVNSANSFMKLTLVTNGAATLNLIQYTDRGWEQIYTTQTTTVKTQLTSLTELLRFGTSDEGDDAILADAILTNPVVALKFKSFSPENLVDFSTAQPPNTKLNQMRILDGILSYFGYTFNDSYADTINSGNPRLVFKLNGKPTDLTFSQVLDDIIQKLNQQNNEYKPTASETYKSYWLDNIIAGTNVIRAMNWKLRQLDQAGRLAPDQRSLALRAGGENANPTPQEVMEKIRDILAQQQGSPAEQAAWQNAMIGSKDFDKFASAFSGRGSSEQDLTKIFNELTKDSVIMARRTIDYSEGYLAPLSQVLKYVWFIAVALIGVGIMTTATISVAAKSKEAKLSEHPMIKWLLLSLIVLGLSVAALALTFGIPAIL